MDFPDPYSFTGQQYQGMMQIPPLTPSHSHSAPSEEFTSPPDNGFQMTGDQMAGFDYMQQQQQQGSAFPGPPTPPNAAFNKFQQQQAQQAQQGQDGDDGTANRGGSDDDDAMTPAQSRRKAQNRAAQRAFRERKERHVKDLEAKLATLEAARAQTSEENERLRRDLAKVSTENEILRATSAINAASSGSSAAAEEARRSGPATTGPMQYQPTDFYSTLLKDHTNKTPSHRVVTGDDGEKLFAAGATWDYILGHDLYKRGLVNIEQVSDRLKYHAKCDGQGPVFAEKSIVEAMEQSIASGSDDLL